MSEMIQIKLTGLDKASAEVVEATHRGILTGLEAAGVEAVGEVVKNIREPFASMPPAVATGNLANAVFATVTTEGMLMRLLVQAGAPADMYADPINSGARAHMPPVNALLPWIKLKFGVEDEKAALKIAWAIALTQAKKGMRGRYMFSRVEDRFEPKAASIIERQIAVALRAAGLGGDVAAS
jgi:hypothetical protein